MVHWLLMVQVANGALVAAGSSGCQWCRCMQVTGGEGSGTRRDIFKYDIRDSSLLRPPQLTSAEPSETFHSLCIKSQS